MPIAIKDSKIDITSEKLTKELAKEFTKYLKGGEFVLLYGEMGLKILNISYPSFYKVDSHRGHSLIQHMFGIWKHEGSASISINKIGLRDKN